MVIDEKCYLTLLDVLSCLQVACNYANDNYILKLVSGMKY